MTLNSIFCKYLGSVYSVNKKQKAMLGRILITSILMVTLHFFPLEGGFPDENIRRMAEAGLYLIPYLVIGYDILRKAIFGIFHGDVFDENFLMAIATTGAMVIGEYEEGSAVMLFYQIGELFQSYAVGKSRRNITELMDIRPDYANIEEDGEIKQIDPDEVEVGSLILVQPGERIPLDGIIESGTTTIDTRALTGESVPRKAGEGDEVLSGCINVSGVIRIRTTKEADESTAAKIIDMVENAGAKKSRSEKFITRFARVYTPIVCSLAVLLAVGAPIVRSFFMGIDPEWSIWFERALIMLVISCPCALVISIPLSFFGGIGGASANGILVKGSNYLEALAETKCVVFDKTGTLTKGVFEVTKVEPQGVSSGELIRYAAYAESFSKHPISLSLKKAYGKDIDKRDVDEYEEISGHGVMAVVDGRKVAAGHKRLMEKLNIKVASPEVPGTIIHVAVDAVYAGFIVVSDVVKECSAVAIKALKQAGVTKTVMLTGDTENTARAVVKEIGIDMYRSELLPGNKVEEVEKLLADKKGNEQLAFVGDGINDAPVLIRADVGIAMGALGSDAAIEAADIVIMDDDPARIPFAMQIARKTLAIVTQNIWLAIGVKGLCIILGAVGYANMWFAIFADVGVMVIAILNAIRALQVDKSGLLCAHGN